MKMYSTVCHQDIVWWLYLLCKMLNLTRKWCPIGSKPYLATFLKMQWFTCYKLSVCIVSFQHSSYWKSLMSKPLGQVRSEELIVICIVYAFPALAFCGVKRSSIQLCDGKWNWLSDKWRSQWARNYCWWKAKEGDIHQEGIRGGGSFWPEPRKSSRGSVVGDGKGKGLIPGGSNHGSKDTVYSWRRTCCWLWLEGRCIWRRGWTNRERSSMALTARFGSIYLTLRSPSHYLQIVLLFVCF